jgi:hypothetical protein
MKYIITRVTTTTYIEHVLSYRIRGNTCYSHLVTKIYSKTHTETIETRKNRRHARKKMAKLARRKMADYKELVNQARQRRKLKEASNKLLIEQNGVVNMCLEQGLLMNTSLVKETRAMQAIEISNETVGSDQGS